MFDIVFVPEARKRFEKLSKTGKKKTQKAIELLAKNPFYGSNVSKLKGKYEGLYRYRTDPYRIVYEVDKDKKLIIILTIVRRSRAYK